MSFKELLTEDQRLVILRSLHEMAGYEANESIIDSCLDAYGHKISRDMVRNHLAWLEEQGLLTLRDVGGCQVARLTGRGEDVATGQAQVPGVKRPRA
ncbi:ArsR family transcriptional regulator [Vibrio fluvialis]|uniref:VpaChn25_0724 family phage protein n=1 Tax=Vibrio fluvialis TaxID=676 RepID=UPI001BB05A6B|nr:ArsR family transcriptional regulator [Vibrio fluvialis]ELE2164755.1 ArsR family transcriptional regulator [Vibrio fluvialis]MBY8111721.1 ArsR family transcriptional regulator [Vibrio fluvialis]MBY8295317.1 ArsR family transcriptional regulator [Vibrio fluvialis]MCE7641077.1 ArsR family transcriptional regulator [Vibrio fluvialis]QUF67768.1 ArsR family transcriptional regulator [Vibrio fluvialis]